MSEKVVDTIHLEKPHITHLIPGFRIQNDHPFIPKVVINHNSGQIVLSVWEGFQVYLPCTIVERYVFDSKPQESFYRVKKCELHTT